MKGNFNILFVSILACLTLPGLADNYSVFLGDYGLRLFAILLLFFNLNKIKKLFEHSKIKQILLLLLLLFFYRTFHVTSGVVHPLLPMISILWVIIIYLTINTEKQFKIFIFCLYISSCIVLLSPGFERILDLSRVGYLESRYENALIGIAVHYIDYAQMTIISFYLSLFYFFYNKSLYIKILVFSILIISFIAIITSGSRGAILTILFSLFCLFLMNNKSFFKNKLRFGFSLVFISFLFSFIPIENILSYFEIMGSKGDLSSVKRFQLYYISFESFYNAPFFGNGWDYIRTTHGVPSHSLVIQLLAELGVLGVIMEFFIYNRFYKLFISLKSQPSFSDSNNYFRLTILFSLLFALGIWSLYENLGFVFGTRQVYIVGALLMCFYKIHNFKTLKL